MKAAGCFTGYEATPQTQPKNQTLDPEWICETEVPDLVLNFGTKVNLTKGHLFLSLYDYDVGASNDRMGQAVLSLAPFAGTSKFRFEEEVTYNSTRQGVIRGEAELIWERPAGFRLRAPRPSGEDCCIVS